MMADTRPCCCAGAGTTARELGADSSGSSSSLKALLSAGVLLSSAAVLRTFCRISCVKEWRRRRKGSDGGGNEHSGVGERNPLTTTGNRVVFGLKTVENTVV
jgi:hypothetical protein